MWIMLDFLIKITKKWQISTLPFLLWIWRQNGRIYQAKIENYKWVRNHFGNKSTKAMHLSTHHLPFILFWVTRAQQSLQTNAKYSRAEVIVVAFVVLQPKRISTVIYLLLCWNVDFLWLKLTKSDYFYIILCSESFKNREACLWLCKVINSYATIADRHDKGEKSNGYRQERSAAHVRKWARQNRNIIRACSKQKHLNIPIQTLLKRFSSFQPFFINWFLRSGLIAGLNTDSCQS